MTKDNTIFLKHILDCICKIEEYTNGMSEKDFLANKLVQDGVIRNFEVIGEATKNISTDFRNMNPNVEWKKMAGMRDKLIHDYIGVDLWAVWGVVVEIIPLLKNNLENIIKKENKEDKPGSSACLEL